MKMKMKSILMLLLLATSLYSKNLEKENYKLVSQAILHQILDLNTKLPNLEREADKRKVNKALDYYKNLLGDILLKEPVSINRYIYDSLDLYKTHVSKNYLNHPIHKEEAKRVISQIDNILPRNYSRR